jgi:hypothetical protein
MTLKPRQLHAVKKGSDPFFDPFFEWSTNIGAVVGRVFLWRQFSAA